MISLSLSVLSALTNTHFLHLAISTQLWSFLHTKSPIHQLSSQSSATNLVSFCYGNNKPPAKMCLLSIVCVYCPLSVYTILSVYIGCIYCLLSVVIVLFNLDIGYCLHVLSYWLCLLYIVFAYYLCILFIVYCLCIAYIVYVYCQCILSIVCVYYLLSNPCVYCHLV